MAGQVSMTEALSRGTPPLRTFMLKQTRETDLALFMELSKTPLILGKHLHIDGDKESFLNDADADGLLSRAYRAPFVVPKEAAL